MDCSGTGERSGHDSVVNRVSVNGTMVMTCARSRRAAKGSEIRWIIDLASHKRARMSDQVD